MAAPNALRVDDFPAQIVNGFAKALIVGVGTTITDVVEEPIQPNKLVPVIL